MGLDELTTCSVCMQRYHASLAEKTPRLLSCGHTFCHQCLDGLATVNGITCPMCRVVTQAQTDSLLKNFTTIALLELPAAPKVDKPSTLAGVKCKAHPTETVCKYCHSCSSFICKECEGSHPSPRHNLMPIDNTIKKFKAKIDCTIRDGEIKLQRYIDLYREDVAIDEIISKDFEEATAQIRQKAADAITAYTTQVNQKADDAIASMQAERDELADMLVTVISEKDDNIKKFDDIFNSESDNLKTIPDVEFIHSMEVISERVNAASASFDALCKKEDVERPRRFHKIKLAQTLAEAEGADERLNFGFIDFAEELAFPIQEVANIIEQVGTTFEPNPFVPFSQTIPYDMDIVICVMSDSCSLIGARHGERVFVSADYDASFTDFVFQIAKQSSHFYFQRLRPYGSKYVIMYENGNILNNSSCTHSFELQFVSNGDNTSGKTVAVFSNVNGLCGAGMSFRSTMNHNYYLCYDEPSQQLLLTHKDRIVNTECASFLVGNAPKKIDNSSVKG